MMNMLLIVVEKVILFFGERVGLEVDGEEMVGCRVHFWQNFRLFAFMHGGGEIEGVGVALLLSVEK